MRNALAGVEKASASAMNGRRPLAHSRMKTTSQPHHCSVPRQAYQTLCAIVGRLGLLSAANLRWPRRATYRLPLQKP